MSDCPLAAQFHRLLDAADAYFSAVHPATMRATGPVLRQEIANSKRLLAQQGNSCDSDANPN